MQSDVVTDVLFLGDRAGVGKTTVGAEISRQLIRLDVSHGLIEGDNLDQAHPEPWRNGIDLAERNLAAMWRNYRSVGYSRLIYTNTVSVLQMPALTTALGEPVRAIGVLLTAEDRVTASRLARREMGSGLRDETERSSRAARELAAEAPQSVHRIATDHRTVEDIATEVVGLTGWQ